ncbi:MAG: hypothetical protein A2902_00185 [Elusimicrobia bacterium RIFCSPLOWO2_01_FULL_64_13]|nr:MAG: hypothetical protein A2636_05990 [Elusimicrobia bacterium RIFCSPHIGHO2_01_FULL_64_10]OGR97995.1 MAG: hypothetical protein A2902_00185 [Elusimicrobia bacterium RIFCSPLOWO2_01_FULL_64_13]
MLNIGIVGLGYWGPNYLRIFSQLDGCNVIAAADKYARRTDQISKSYPQVEVFSDFRDMIRQVSLDAVVIATPTTTHFPFTSEILSKGCHVLLEKPLAMTTDESKFLCRLADKKKKVLMVGHTFLFNKAVYWIKKAIKTKKIGNVFYIHAQRTNLGPIRHDVNALYDLAPHDISMILYLLDKDPVRVSANGAAFLNKDREDVCYVHLEFKDGTMGHIHVSWLEPRKVRQLTVIGDEKMIVFDDVNLTEPVRVFNKGVTVTKEYKTFGEFQMVLRDGNIIIPKIKLSEPLKTQCQAFLNAIESGKKPFSNGLFGLKVVRVLEAANQSLKTGGKPVRIRA